jgi:ribose-phosphate pyrophosphokinase
MIVFATASYRYIQEEMVQEFQFNKGALHRNVFPDGEIYHQILTQVNKQEVLLVGGTASDTDCLELLDLAIGIIEQGAHTLHIAIPYFGYSTMERRVYEGDVVKAKTRALLFSALPTSHCKVNVLLFDLHSEGIPYYFPQNIFTNHIYCKSLIIKAAKALGGDHFVLAATDAGRAKWVESLAQEIGCDAAFIYKRRESGSQTNITGINADVNGKNVLIYDDMIRTGGSLIQAAKAYKANGAQDIYVLTTHGIFVGDALDKIADTNTIKKVWCTNSHPNAVNAQHALLQVSSIAGLIKENC